MAVFSPPPDAGISCLGSNCAVNSWFCVASRTGDSLFYFYLLVCLPTNKNPHKSKGLNVFSFAMQATPSPPLLPSSPPPPAPLLLSLSGPLRHDAQPRGWRTEGLGSEFVRREGRVREREREREREIEREGEREREQERG